MKSFLYKSFLPRGERYWLIWGVMVDPIANSVGSYWV